MLVAGIAALITLIFFGGGPDYFLVADLKPNVKKVVVEKERRKEILSKLSVVEKEIKTNQKENAQKFKTFLHLYGSKSADREALLKSFDDIHEQRLAFQSKIADERIKTLEMIKQAEWDLIIKRSVAQIEKKEKKEAKKQNRNEAYFLATQKVISKVVDDKEKELLLETSLADMVKVLKKFSTNLNSVNTKENKIIANKNATKKELLDIAKEINQIRYSGIEQLVAFHETVKNHTTDEEWTPIIKAFSKELKNYAQ